MGLDQPEPVALESGHDLMLTPCWKKRKTFENIFRIVACFVG
jgi:hypothetical protein